MYGLWVMKNFSSVHKLHFLLAVEYAWFCFTHDPPFDRKFDLFVRKGPHIFAKSCCMSAFFVVEGVFMSRKSCLETIFCETNICFIFHVVLSGYSSLVHNPFCETFIFYWTLIAIAAVAGPCVVIRFWFSFGQCRFVVSWDDIVDIGHTAIA